MFKTFSEILARFSTGQMNKKEFIAAMFEKHRTLFEYPALLKQSEIKEIKILSDCVRFQIGEPLVTLEVPTTDHRSAPLDILNFGCYEEKERELILALVKRSRVFFDVGANIGYYSILAKKAVPSCQIYAFEPIPSTRAILKKNLRLNGVDVQCLDVGLSFEEQEGVFFFDRSLTVNASLRSLQDEGDYDEVRVPLRRMDSLSIPDPDFVKVDVEGAELWVVQGAEGLMRRNPPMFFLEMLRKWSTRFGYHPNEIICLMSKFGYDCYSIGSTIKKFELMDHTTLETNFVFLHREKHLEMSRLICDFGK